MRKCIVNLMFAAGLALGLAAALPAQNSNRPSTSAKAKGTGMQHDISGVWNANYKGGNMVPKDVTMTPWAQAKFAGNNNTTDPYLQCAPLGPTRWTQYVHDHPFEIVQTPDRIYFFFEVDHEWRTVYMDGRPVPKLEDLSFGPTYMGYSVGHWDGNDLVVDTVGANDLTWIDAEGHPHSDEMHVTERYHRMNQDTLELSFSFNDPKAYSKPFTYGPKPFELKTGPRWEILDSECTISDEKNFNHVVDTLNSPGSSGNRN